jgi:hypothetical protein
MELMPSLLPKLSDRSWCPTELVSFNASTADSANVWSLLIMAFRSRMHIIYALSSMSKHSLCSILPPSTASVESFFLYKYMQGQVFEEHFQLAPGGFHSEPSFSRHRKEHFVVIIGKENESIKEKETWTSHVGSHHRHTSIPSYPPYPRHTSHGIPSP